MNYIRSLILKFDIPLRQSEITKFRGAVVASLENKDILFHNHRENGLRYSYPLIQYKIIQQKAAIVCFGEGTDAIAEFFTQKNLLLPIGEKIVDIKLEDIKAGRTMIQLWEKPMAYRLRKWAPLNGDNYKKYTCTTCFDEKKTMLESILLGNILSALKGLNITIKEKIQCTLSEIKPCRLMQYKNTKLMAFDIEFSSNISLPQYMGLGKHASNGFGILTKNSKYIKYE